MISNALLPPWVENLGWSLIHTLWQAPLLFLFMHLLLKMLGNRKAVVRHAIATCTLVGVVVLFLGTFIWLQQSTVGSAEGGLAQPTDGFVLFGWNDAVLSSTSGWAQAVQVWVDAHLNLFVLAWLVGTMVFSLRIGFAWWQIHHLRTHALPVAPEWVKKMQAVAAAMKINKPVWLAEANVHSPVVIGYLKPMILFPIGLLANLSTEQVEAILVHELSHIQRNDYWVNLFQCVVEIIFFFNPFVWLVSDRIRQEREYCCDDAVIQFGSAPLVYARTLAELEELRLSATVALGLAGNKHQLLDRIKRIMEKTVKKEAGNTRLLPIVLILLTLVCTSWFSIQHTAPEEEWTAQQADDEVAADTTKEKMKEAATYERRTITRWDENGQPHEETTEIYEGHLDPGAFDFPSMPGFPSFPGFPDVAAVPGVPDAAFSPFWFAPDSLPRTALRHLSEEEWLAFEEAFTARFKAQFRDFYEKNGELLSELMAEAREKSVADSRNWEKDFEKEMQQLEREFAQIAPQMREMELSLPDMARMEAEIARQEAEVAERAAEMAAHEAEMSRWAADMKAHEKEMKEWESRSRQFEKALKEQLVEDGYLSKTEPINSFQISDDGEMEINGIKIKTQDKARYRDLHRKYFKNARRFSYSE